MNEPEVAEVPVTKMYGSEIDQAQERIALRDQQRRAHLSLRGRRARRASVLTARDYANEARRVRRAADRLGLPDEAALSIGYPDIELVSSQPDPGRAVRRANGIRRAFGLGNQPYRKPAEESK